MKSDLLISVSALNQVAESLQEAIGSVDNELMGRELEMLLTETQRSVHRIESHADLVEKLQASVAEQVASNREGVSVA